MNGWMRWMDHEWKEENRWEDEWENGMTRMEEWSMDS